jgi:4-amino-4-deoxy-L-arabinose transferase-like glycosyltransferase
MLHRLVSMSRAHRALLIILLAGLIVRVILLAGFADTGLEIVDEQHYHELAVSLVEGRGFYRDEHLTSMRPPLYSAMIAGLWLATGTDDLQVIRGLQIVLSLANVVLVYALAASLFSRRVGVIAAGLFCFYPTLIVYDYLILTEVLFTFLLTLAVLACVKLVKNGSPLTAAGAGVTIGLAALARSVLWPFPLVLCPVLAFLMPGSVARRIGVATMVFAAYAVTIAPWAIRNTQLQQVPVVIDTMGGINLRLGNFERTPHVRMWDAVSLTGDQSWSYELRLENADAATWTEGQREKWAQRKAIEFMLANPGLTAWRAVIKFADFWGLEREVLAGLQRGNYVPSGAVKIATILLITGAYPLVLCLAVIGGFVAPPAWRMHVILLLFVAFVCGIHMIVYGHSRYHVPLVAIMVVYAAAAIESRGWQRLKESLRVAAPPLAVIGVMLVVWMNQALLDADRIRGLLQFLR